MTAKEIVMTQIGMDCLVEEFKLANDPIYSVWDTRTEDKILLCASNDRNIAYACILDSALATKEQKDAVLKRVNKLSMAEKYDAPSLSIRCECGSGVHLSFRL